MEYQEIIDKILETNQEEIAKIKANAKKQCTDIEANASKQISEIEEKADIDSKAMRAELLARRLTVAELDVKKILLNAKQEIIDDVYAIAKQQLQSLPTTQYKKLVEGMLIKAAGDGDEVLIGKCDEKTITASFVKKIADKKGIKLTLAVDDKINGGVILRGKSCDKNLTIDLEVAAIKLTTETDIAKRLFNE